MHSFAHTAIPTRTTSICSAKRHRTTAIEPTVTLRYVTIYANAKVTWSGRKAQQQRRQTDTERCERAFVLDHELGPQRSTVERCTAATQQLTDVAAFSKCRAATRRYVGCSAVAVRRLRSASGSPLRHPRYQSFRPSITPHSEPGPSRRHRPAAFHDLCGTDTPCWCQLLSCGYTC